MRTYSTRALDVVSVSSAGHIDAFVPIRTIMYQGGTHESWFERRICQS
jgi:hypothetical protein